MVVIGANTQKKRHLPRIATQFLLDVLNVEVLPAQDFPGDPILAPKKECHALQLDFRVEKDWLLPDINGSAPIRLFVQN